MKNYQVQLTNGQTINLLGVESFDADAYAALLNNREILFINIAGSVVNKNLVLAIVQIQDNPTESLEVL